MNAVEFNAVTYDGTVLCIGCLPEGIGDDSEGVEPIFCASEWDNYPVCDDCGKVHEYVSLTEHGRKLHRLSDTKCTTWFERDRANVDLRSEKLGEMILDIWDEDVTQAVEDGFLNPKNWHQSIYDYALHLGLITAT